MKIKICDLSKKYGEKLALDHFTAEFGKGVYGLLGPNGVGKSTLMNIMVGNLEASSGFISFDGTDIRKMGKEYRRLLGYMPQHQRLYPTFNGMEFLRYMAILKDIPKNKISERIDWAAYQVNLQDELNKKLYMYSGGMKQRILLAAAVLNKPQILILDEPTAGLDPRERIRIRNLISGIAAERFVLIATHVVSDVEHISNEIILMKNGKILRKNMIVNLTNEVRPYVFEMNVSISKLGQIEKNYQVSNILSDGQCARVRIIANRKPESKSVVNAIPTLDEVYLYHFG